MIAPASARAPSKTDDWLANLPISFFAIVMSLTGLTIASHKLEQTLGLHSTLSTLLFWLSAAIYVLIVFAYLAKMALHPASVTWEWAHPVRISFFPSSSISALLLSIAALNIDQTLSLILWVLGAGMHFLFIVVVITKWINNSRYQVEHLNPVWFLPVVGSILVPIAGLHHAPADISWFFFSVGIVFGIMFLGMVINRLIFYPMLADPLKPTLFILIAPPAVGFIAWSKLIGDLDPFGRILFFSAFFFFILVSSQLVKLIRRPFVFTFWAMAFPVAALTISSFLMAEMSGALVYLWIAYGLYAILAGIILLLAIRTLVAMARGEIFVQEK